MTNITHTPRGIALINADSGYVYAIGADISEAQRETTSQQGSEEMRNFEDKLKSAIAAIDATDWYSADVQIEVIEDGSNDCYEAVVWLSDDMQERFGIDGGVEVKGNPLRQSVEFSCSSGEELSVDREPSSPDEQEIAWRWLLRDPAPAAMSLVCLALEIRADELADDECWFEFAGDAPDDKLYGWGTRAEADEYLDLVNATDERRYAMCRVTEAERVKLDLDNQYDETFNLSDTLIGLRAEAA